MRIKITNKITIIYIAWSKKGVAFFFFLSYIFHNNCTSVRDIMYVTLSRVIFYARHVRSIIDNYARLGCYVRTYAYAHVSNITSRKIIFHMKTDRGRLKLQFRSFRRLALFNLFLFQ